MYFFFFIFFCFYFLVFSYFILLSYWDLYGGVMSQNENVLGISEDSRSKRKRKNLVTLKFNLMNWIVETISILLLIFFPNGIVIIIYILLNSCATPIIYFMGMEENRKKDLKSLIEILSKKQLHNRI